MEYSKQKANMLSSLRGRTSQIRDHRSMRFNSRREKAGDRPKEFASVHCGDCVTRLPMFGQIVDQIERDNTPAKPIMEVPLEVI